jgi:hypothetical protein
MTIFLSFVFVRHLSSFTFHWCFTERSRKAASTELSATEIRILEIFKSSGCGLISDVELRHKGAA